VWTDGTWRATGAGGVTVIGRSGSHRFEPGEIVAGVPGPDGP